MRTTWRPTPRARANVTFPIILDRFQADQCEPVPRPLTQKLPQTNNGISWQAPVRARAMTGTDESLRRLIYTWPTSFKYQAEVLDNLPEQIQKGDLIGVDSFTGLYRVKTGDSQKTFLENKELNRQLGEIKEIALSKRVEILLSGHVRNIYESPVPAIEPVAQCLLRFWSDTVIRLENTSSHWNKAGFGREASKS